MHRRTLLQMLPVLFLALRPLVGATAETSVAHLRIDGMTWGAWPVLVKRALEGLKGVRNADVSFEREEAVVTYEEGAVTMEQMQEAVARYGFTATLKSPSAK